MMNSPLLNFAISVAKKAGSFVLQESDKPMKISKKSKNNLVTQADKASEKLIINEIKKAYPNHAIIAEESSFKNPKTLDSITNAKYIWLVDPIDGTTNFAHGLYQYAISLGLFKKKIVNASKNYQYLEGELILGVVFAPALGELFYAEKGKGAFLEKIIPSDIKKSFRPKIHSKIRLKVSKTKKVSESLLVTGFPTEGRELSVKYFTKMIYECQAIRRLGSAALDLCYTAAGYFDGYWEFKLKAWDIAAGALIVSEAGGKVTDTNGNLLDLYGQDILASNGKVHKEMVKIFRKI